MLAFILARSLNLDCAGAFAKIKFHARMRCFVKDTVAKPARLLSIYAVQALSHIGATLDVKFKQMPFYTIISPFRHTRSRKF
mgnify:CR=1 FL=1